MKDKKQPEALRLANVCSNLTRYSMDAHLIAAELRRQHAELETLRTGYDAARLEIESLQSQLHAAKQINAAQFNLLAASIPGSAMRPPHAQAPAQAAPAAVAGPSGYGPKATVKRSCSDCKACNSESYAVQGDSGHYVYCEHPSLPERKYIGDTHWDTPDWCPAAAPTTQPAPEQEVQEPVAVIGAGFTIFWAGHGPIAQIVERHALKVGSPLYAAPQPSPAAQGDENA